MDSPGRIRRSPLGDKIETLRSRSPASSIFAPNHKYSVPRGIPEGSDMRNGSDYSSGISLNSDKSMGVPLRFRSRSPASSIFAPNRKYPVLHGLPEGSDIRNGSDYSSGISLNSDISMGVPPRFRIRRSPLGDNIETLRNGSDYSSGIFLNSDKSMEVPLRFRCEEVDEVLKQMGFSPALPAHSYAGPDDLTCDICTVTSGEKIKAVKSCLTCGVSCCETHVRNHYTVEAFNQHELVDATNDLKQNRQENKTLEEFFLPEHEIKAQDPKTDSVELLTSTMEPQTLLVAILIVVILLSFLAFAVLAFAILAFAVLALLLLESNHRISRDTAPLQHRGIKDKRGLPIPGLEPLTFQSKNSTFGLGPLKFGN